MKIAILTFHRACNYGAVLQAYALQTFLNVLPEVETEILDYYSPGVYDVFAQFGLLKRKGSLVKKIVVEILLFNAIAKRNRLFSAFRKKYFRIEQHDVKQQELSEVVERYDCVIVGSDQVWNTELTQHDWSFFLNFVPDNVGKFSYAASIGKPILEKEELQSSLDLLEGFDVVSLREPTFVEEFQRKLPGKEVRCDIDPVFLLNAEEWRQFSRREKREPYVLFFTLSAGNPAIPTKDYAMRLAEKMGVRGMYVSSEDRWFRFRDMEHTGVCSPEEFVGLIDGAECVVTNSFHAMAFSMILHKPFYVDIGAAFNSRMLHLLEQTGLSNRAIREGELLGNDETIDWDVVDARLAEVSAKSKTYLQRVAKQDLCGDEICSRKKN